MKANEGKCIFQYQARNSFIHSFIHSFLETGEGREKEKERNSDVRKKHGLAASHMLPNQGMNPNPGLGPDWELNRQTLVLQDDTQPTEPHQSGPKLGFHELQNVY